MKIETFALPPDPCGSAPNYRRFGVRLDLFNEDYDDVVRKLIGCTTIGYPGSYQFLVRDASLDCFRDKATGRVVFGIGVRGAGKKKSDAALAVDVLTYALGDLAAMLEGKGGRSRGAAARAMDLAGALEGRLSGREEAEKFGRPFSPVQSEIYSAIADEVARLDAEREAAEDAAWRKYEAEKNAVKARYARKFDIIMGYRQAAVKEINAEKGKAIRALRKEYGKKIAELKARAREAV